MFVSNQMDKYIQCYCTGACKSSGICPNAMSISPYKKRYKRENYE
jgi:hypothetical protein